MKNSKIIVLYSLLLIFTIPIIGVLGQSDIIVDNSGATYVGTWQSSTYVDGYYGNDYRHHVLGVGSNTATWSFNIPVSGTWEVYAWWSSSPSRPTNAPYTINHAGGSSTVRVNQEQNGGTWNSLGVYSFNADSYSIQLSDDADDTVVADAIRLEYIAFTGYTITYHVNGQGAIEAIPSGPYSLDTDVTLTATPSAGWEFTGWSGDLFGTTNPSILTMDDFKSVTATFNSLGDIQVGTQKNTYNRLENLVIQITDGTYLGSVIIQVNNGANVLWFDVKPLDSSGDLNYLIKIPNSWQDGFYTIHVKDIESKTTDSVNIQIPTPLPPPPSGPPSSGGGVVSSTLPHVTVVEFLSPQEAAKLLDNFDADDVAELLETVKDIDHIASIITHFDENYASTVLSLLSPELAGKLLINWDEPYAIAHILGLTQDDTRIIESMIDYNFTDSVTLIEKAVKETLTLTESEKTEALEKLSQSLGSIDSNVLVELFVSIARLPETPSTVAHIINTMQLDSVIDVIFIWLLDETYEYSLNDLANVFNYVSVDRLGELYISMTGEERIILLDLISENLISRLPVVGEFHVVDFNYEPNEVEEGQTVTIMYKIVNVGTETDDYIVPLKINGETHFTDKGILSAGESVEITHSLLKETPGTYQLTLLDETVEFVVKTSLPIIQLLPAEFIISSIELAPIEIFEGDTVNVFATIENIGELPGSSVIELKLDNHIYESREIFLIAENQLTILFDFTADLTSGFHELSVMDTTTTFEVSERQESNSPYFTSITVLVILAVGGYYYMKRTDLDLNELIKPLRR